MPLKPKKHKDSLGKTKMSKAADNKPTRLTRKSTAMKGSMRKNYIRKYTS